MDVVDYWSGYEWKGLTPEQTSSDMEPGEILQNLLPLLPKTAVTPDSVFAMVQHFSVMHKSECKLASELMPGMLDASNRSVATST